MTPAHLNKLLAMAHSPIRNYALPGLTSKLLSRVRLFECDRDHQEEITPHSHRFDFVALVLAGEVRNRLWSPSGGDLFHAQTLHYEGACGKYRRESGEIERWRYHDDLYGEGDSYEMGHAEVHSIHFSRGARVLFFEGPTVCDSSIILEPHVDGETIPTFRVEPWMFRRVGGAAA